MGQSLELLAMRRWYIDASQMIMIIFVRSVDMWCVVFASRPVLEMVGLLAYNHGTTLEFYPKHPILTAVTHTDAHDADRPNVTALSPH
jgi:hypothetical protein